MAVKIYELGDLIKEAKEFAAQPGVMFWPVRVQGVAYKQGIPYGETNVMHDTVDVIVTAKMKGEVYEYTERVGMVHEGEDARRKKTLQKKANDRETAIITEIEAAGLKTAKGRYE